VILTLQQLASACSARIDRAQAWLPYLTEAMTVYAIHTPDRAAAFLAQVGHESFGLKYVREIWGPTPAQSGYEGRADLGNTQPGDGYRYCGRGLLQTTGRANYRALTRRLREHLAVTVPDFEAEPQKLEEHQWAAYSAGDFWDMKGLNALADAGDFMRITRKINGGTNGYEDRLARWETAKGVLA
jgi:putative chitinase